VFGVIVAWVLVRYDFPGKAPRRRLVDLPFALPTAVAGIALTSLYAENGWIGRSSRRSGIKVAYTPLGIVVALTFIGLPFVVRTVQPVLEDLEPEIEDAAAVLGAGACRRCCASCSPACCRRWPPGSRSRSRGAGRVRLRRVHRRQHADGLGDHAPAHHDQAGAVRLRGSDGDRARLPVVSFAMLLTVNALARRAAARLRMR
jgi:hypothetical protein